jgi:hypothetical protein
MKNFALFILLTVLLSNCAPNAIKLNKEFKDKKMNFSINYPESWDFDSMKYEIKEPITGLKDVFQEKIVLGAERNPAKQSAIEFAKANQTSYKLLDSNFKGETIKAIHINNLDAAVAHFNTIQNGMNYKNTLYTVAIDSNIFYAQCNALDTSAASHLDIFTAIIFSIKPAK